MPVIASLSGPTDASLRRRASRSLPGGGYGHVSADAFNFPGAPQFVQRAEGSRFWDVDGNEFVDLMCSWGPILLGHRHPRVEAAVQEQHALADCGNGPAPVMVDLAERLVEVVDHADWARFAKNGSDATTLCLTLARADTGRTTILAAQGAYHGALPWCNPFPLGSVPGDRAHLAYYRYNDLGSVQALVDAHDGDIAGVIVSPFRHDAGFDQEMPDPAFAQGLRDICDRIGAHLILDDVRAGFRLHYGSSWEPLGVAPDLSAWSKAMANGYPIAAVLGNDRIRETAEQVFATGSFWYAADAMAAALATLDVLKDDHGIEHMHRWGQDLWSGFEERAASRSIEMSITGHVTMPYVTFPNDAQRHKNDVFAAACAQHGLFVHPRHNWFVSTALDDDDLESALDAIDAGLEAVSTHHSA